MMRDIDELLAGLRADSADVRLAGLDDAVLAGLALRRDRGAARRTIALTGAAALIVGLVGSVSAPRDAQAVPSFLLNTLPAAAPSSLLMGAR